MQMGLLVLSVSDDRGLCLTVPHMGKLWSALSRGRKDITGAFKGKRLQQIKDTELRMRLASSHLGAAFLLADAEGRNAITAKRSGVGLVWQLED
jgi:hypothetical protein